MCAVQSQVLQFRGQWSIKALFKVEPFQHMDPQNGRGDGEKTDLVTGHEHFLRDVKFEEFRIKVIDERGNNLVDMRSDPLDGIRIMRSEVKEVGKVCYSVVEGGLDELGIDFLSEDHWTVTLHGML